MASARGTMATTRLRKIECPGCGLKLRGSRAPIGRVGLPTCGCGTRMMFADVEDCAAVCPDELHEHPGAAADMDAWTRRALRESVRLVAGSLRCGGCQRFVRSARERCGCGFENDISGGRNHGRWVEGASFCREAREEEMPF